MWNFFNKKTYKKTSNNQKCLSKTIEGSREASRRTSYRLRDSRETKNLSKNEQLEIYKKLQNIQKIKSYVLKIKNRILKNNWFEFQKVLERPLKTCLRHGRPFEADIYSYPHWCDVGFPIFLLSFLFIYNIYINMGLRKHGCTRRSVFQKAYFQILFIFTKDRKDGKLRI